MDFCFFLSDKNWIFALQQECLRGERNGLEKE
jgi:hypothetical protein